MKNFEHFLFPCFIRADRVVYSLDVIYILIHTLWIAIFVFWFHCDRSDVGTQKSKKQLIGWILDDLKVKCLKWKILNRLLANWCVFVLFHRRFFSISNQNLHKLSIVIGIVVLVEFFVRRKKQHLIVLLKKCSVSLDFV